MKMSKIVKYKWLLEIGHFFGKVGKVSQIENYSSNWLPFLLLNYLTSFANECKKYLSNSKESPIAPLDFKQTCIILFVECKQNWK